PAAPPTSRAASCWGRTARAFCTSSSSASSNRPPECAPRPDSRERRIMTLPADQHALVLQAAHRIMEAEALLVAAGAGIGVDSGLPDFRGRDGFWRAYPALGRAGLAFEQIANPAAFARDPTLARSEEH